ncbi:MAG: NAD(P)-dependent oxidoreductase [Candidatus Brocadiia bacterium]
MANILLYERVPEAWFEPFADFLRQNQPDDLALDLVQPEGEAPDDALALVPDADVLVVGLTGQHRAVGRRVFEDAVRLKLVQKLGSREEGVDVVAAIDGGVPVSLLPAPAHVACAEHTLMAILALTKKLLPAVEAAKPRRIGRAANPAPPPAEPYAYNWAGLDAIGILAGKTLGLVGMGHIAVEVARRARAFAMTVLYHDEPALPDDEADELGVAYRPLDDLVAEADVLSLHAALTPATEGLIHAERIARMKPSALLVNTARGGLVDEQALADALADGRLAGAAVDAWAAEPVPPDHPLLKPDNVLPTPHVAAGTLPPEATFEALLPNILAALQGEPIEGLVTPPPLDLEEPGQPPEEETEGQEGESAEHEPDEPAEEGPTPQD